tara:strand:+ start:13387 stop:13707 length:321 start_codon:yes stop_codon:yes gene_type:complete
VEIRDRIRFKLREAYGDVETYLENTYEQYLTENIYISSIDNKKKWMTYNQVILELKHNLKDMLRVKELQYKLTETTNPNETCIEVLSSLSNLTPELDRLYNKIRNF